MCGLPWLMNLLSGICDICGVLDYCTSTGKLVKPSIPPCQKNRLTQAINQRVYSATKGPITHAMPRHNRSVKMLLLLFFYQNKQTRKP